jgi:hypothetical protein
VDFLIARSAAAQPKAISYISTMLRKQGIESE